MRNPFRWKASIRHPNSVSRSSRTPPAPPEQTTGEDALDDGIIARLAAVYVSGRTYDTEKNKGLAALQLVLGDGDLGALENIMT